ncbi:MAG TPA: ABC transporter permease [Chryseosolibacter sp.]
MLKNYLKIAFRSLWRSKAHSLINIVGLSIGIACCVLIALFVKDELTFDRFHSNAGRIYRAYVIEDWGVNQQFIDITTPFPLGPALKENLQEVEFMVRRNNIGTQVRIDDKLFSESATIVGVDFLEMFDFELIEGEKTDILRDASAVLLTEEMAKRFFGEQDAVGRTLSMLIGEKFEEFSVKGVLRDPPMNSSIRFGIVMSDLNYPKLYSERALTSGWFNITPETYVMLKEGADPAEVSKKFPSIFKPLLGDDYEKSKYFVGLQPLTKIHLDTSLPAGIAPVSDPKYSYILSAIAILILVVGCINFVTLSIGRSLKRSKEVGIRKVAGAQRQQLVFQFIGEAMIITILALTIGMALSYLCLPIFNDLSGKTLRFPMDGFLLLMSLALVAIIGMFAGSYPAFVLSSFRPIAVLKGALQTGSSKQTLRKVLVGVQLVLSIFLISSTLLMRDQLQFLQEKNLGFNKEQLAVIQLNVSSGRGIRERVPKGFEQAEQFKMELARLPQIISVSASSHDFGNGNWVNMGFTDDKSVYRTFNYNTIDDDFIGAMNIEVVAGRNFSDEIPSDKRRSLIVNEAFARMFGWSDPVGKKIPGKNFEDHEIIGMVKDFNYQSLYTKVEPLVMGMDPATILSGIENINMQNSPIPKLFIRLKPGNASATLAEIEKIWDKITGGEEFTFQFVDESLNAQYRSDQNLGKIVSLTTLLAILIGSLGLYGLASLAMQNRTKEISIRKVLGASEQSLLILLSKDYVILIGASLLISIPITWYLMKDWLSTFEYRIDIDAGVFLLSGGISLAIALMTISYEAVKTAWSQPAKTLKYE